MNRGQNGENRFKTFNFVLSSCVTPAFSKKIGYTSKELCK